MQIYKETNKDGKMRNNKPEFDSASHFAAVSNVFCLTDYYMLP